MTFREQLLHDHLSESEAPNGGAVLWALKELEDYDVMRKERREGLKYGLLVINAYRKESEELRDGANILANPDAARKNPKTALRVYINEKILGIKDSPENQRDGTEDVGNKTVELINLAQIEKLMRVLAKKLHIQMIEPPGHGKARQ